MNKSEKAYLLYLVRNEIAKRLRIKWQGYKDVKTTAPAELNQKKGTFVTLTIGDNLRGCIGQITPDETMEETIKENAISAAFHDPRFEPLTEGEFYKIDVEISILSVPQRLDLEKVEQDVHGVIIKCKGRSATFLPQVWEDLPSKDEFFSHLCMKAGLSCDEWKKGTLEVYTYTVEHFNETELKLGL